MLLSPHDDSRVEVEVADADVPGGEAPDRVRAAVEIDHRQRDGVLQERDPVADHPQRRPVTGGALGVAV